MLRGKIYNLTESTAQTVMIFELDATGQASAMFVDPDWQDSWEEIIDEGILDTYHGIGTGGPVYPRDGDHFIRTLPFAFHGSHMRAEVEET